jgi:O6-methylguanine-DNA--protein-cysteine methyltransferase
VARPRKSAEHDLTPGQASYVIQRLIGDRKITRNDLQRYVNDMRREIGELEARLASLKAATGSAIRSAISALRPGRRGRPPASEAAAGGRKRRRARITPEQLASRKLQGRYLGLIRQIPASRRAQYQKIAKDKGREAAIKEMQTALNK